MRRQAHAPDAMRGILRLLRALGHALAGWLTIVFIFPRLDTHAREARVQVWARQLLRILGVGFELRGQPLGVRALTSHPRKSEKGAHGGHREIPIEFLGVRFLPGHWLYADEDGLLVSPRPLHLGGV